MPRAAGVAGQGPQASAGFAERDAAAGEGQRRATAWLAEQSGARIGLLAAIGGGLLIASELVDRLDRMEGDFGLGALNLIFALPIAVLIVATTALIGDSLLRASERRLRRRPEGRALGVLMIAAGATAAGAIVAAHLSRPLALDGWLGIAGGLLLILAGTAHHQLTHTVRKAGRGR